MKKIGLLVAFIALTLSNYAQNNSSTDKKEPVKIYNPDANAKADLALAVKKAKAEKKHVFVQVGGNWCVWCIKFHNLVESTPELKQYLNDHYVPIKLNYSPDNKNEAILNELGNPGRFGYPVFLIINEKGKLIHTQNSEYLEEGDGHSVKKIMAFLKNWNYTAVHSAVK